MVPLAWHCGMILAPAMVTGARPPPFG